MPSRWRHIGIHLWRGKGPYWERAGRTILMPPDVGDGGPRGLASIIGLRTVKTTGALAGHGWLLNSIEPGVIGFYAAGRGGLLHQRLRVGLLEGGRPRGLLHGPGGLLGRPLLGLDPSLLTLSALLAF
jgi:hypothetical protein